TSSTEAPASGWRRGRCRSRGVTSKTSPDRSLNRPDEGVTLLAGGELDDAFGRHLVEGDGDGFVRNHDIVDPGAAAADQAPRLAVAGGEAGAPQQLEGGYAAFELAPRHLEGRQPGAHAALDEGPPCGFRRLG